MKMITLDDIREHDPCYDPLCYVTEDWTGTIADVLRMEDVPPADRVWLATRPGMIDPGDLATMSRLAAARHLDKWDPPPAVLDWIETGDPDTAPPGAAYTAYTAAAAAADAAYLASTAYAAAAHAAYTAAYTAADAAADAAYLASPAYTPPAYAPAAYAAYTAERQQQIADLLHIIGPAQTP
jgi:hypothetical protein